MKTRYFIVSGDIAKPIPDRMQDKATHSLSLTNEFYNKYSGSYRYFKVIDGVPVAKTQEEIDIDEAQALKDNAIQDAESLYEVIKNNCCVDYNGETYDLSDNISLEHQQRKQLQNVGTKLKKGKVKFLQKSDSDAIEDLLFTKRTSAAIAFNADMDAIELGDYSLSNLKALQ